MKHLRADARSILHFFGGIRRSTRLRSASFGGSTLRIHLWAYAHALLRRRIEKCRSAQGPFIFGQQTVDRSVNMELAANVLLLPS